MKFRLKKNKDLPFSPFEKIILKKKKKKSHLPASSDLPGVRQPEPAASPPLFHSHSLSPTVSCFRVLSLFSLLSLPSAARCLSPLRSPPSLCTSAALWLFTRHPSAAVHPPPLFLSPTASPQELFSPIIANFLLHSFHLSLPFCLLFFHSATIFPSRAFHLLALLPPVHYNLHSISQTHLHPSNHALSAPCLVPTMVISACLALQLACDRRYRKKYIRGSHPFRRFVSPSTIPWYNLQS